MAAVNVPYLQELAGANFRYVVPGVDLIMAGEIGRYEKHALIEQTNIASAAWTNAKSDTAFFGQDTVAEGVVVPEEIRGAIPTDYGCALGIAFGTHRRLGPCRIPS